MPLLTHHLREMIFALDNENVYGRGGIEMDGFSTHLTTVSTKLSDTKRSGSNLEAVLDLMKVTVLKWNIVKPHIISEFGVLLVLIIQMKQPLISIMLNQYDHKMQCYLVF